MKETIYEVGFWSGLVAFSAGVGFNIVQILQLFHVTRYPLDEILIYGFSLCMVIPLIAFVYFSPNFSEKLLLIGIPWIITAPLAMLLLAVMFRKELEPMRVSIETKEITTRF